MWIHRDREILKLQCGFEEHTGTSTTFLMTDREHPSDDEFVTEAEDDANYADETTAQHAYANAEVEDSGEAVAAATTYSNYLVQHPCVDGRETSPIFNHGFDVGYDIAIANISEDSSSDESWYDIDRTYAETFEQVSEDALQARVEQWLREQRPAHFPSVCARDDAL